MKNPRRLILSLVVVAALVLSGWLADTAAAARVEHHLAREVAKTSQLKVTPRISAGPSPYLLSLFQEKFSHISADVYDVDVPGFGMVNARSEAIGITATREQILSGDFDGATAELIRRTISLDGVAFGRLLHVTDLDLSHPYDISPAGGTATEARLRGTPAGWDEPIDVTAKLRLEGTTFRLIPFVVNHAPDGREDEALRAFELSFDTRTLPLAGPAQAVGLSGGSIRFSAEKRNAELRIPDLSPLDTGNGDPAGDPAHEPNGVPTSIPSHA